MITLSAETRNLVTEFAMWKARGDNSTTIFSLWRDFLLKAFDNKEAVCDDEIADILKDAKLSDDMIEKYLGDFGLCMWILKEYSDHQRS